MTSLPRLILMILLALFLAVLVGLFLFSAWRARAIEAAHPNIGSRTDLGDISLNALDVPAGPGADLPTLVFVHGASGNLRDPMGAFLEPLKGRARLLFVDRPGHGYSDRGDERHATPKGQADAIARLMTAKGIDRAIVIGHSFGGAITAALAVHHPEKVQGLVFLSAATHPWPGGVDWYYDLSNTPVVGWLFTRLLALPAGLSRLDSGTRYVFYPNPRPDDYIEKTAPSLVLRPETFRSNATDVANLLAYVTVEAKRYPEIKAPTVIITGDSDQVVLQEIHSKGLARDIEGSELVWLKGVGHKPDYVATDLAIAAIEKLAGQPRDLQAMARVVEERVAKTRLDR